MQNIYKRKICKIKKIKININKFPEFMFIIKLYLQGGLVKLQQRHR
jgi:hypothetical protein